MFIYKTRRKKYLESIQNDSITIIFGNREKYRNNDVKYKFRQNSSFLYLLGLKTKLFLLKLNLFILCIEIKDILVKINNIVINVKISIFTIFF